jgi:hypothetical protein
MISRKNDGTVKMTRQRATSRAWLLGMTGNATTVDRYLETRGRKTPKDVVADRQRELRELEKMGTCITYREDHEGKYKLYRRGGGEYWWVREQPRGTLKSLTYSSRARAISAFQNERITWIEFLPPEQEGNGQAVPWSSLDERQ